ncbi:TetR family transcriptional regulator [Glycomyces sp. L485]|uniref:TetR/AcrR family transcriptional regulator n=1 Tax=Glycomyces sp. L485 TaxID=2909235 RepID=UPI001F4A82A8|nr:TetR family transcriptional regulator [Glycomyces sp. L485]MCH7230353.1 TetR family transcriptional regulator [Glycomyces sp. L485]
MAEPTGLRERKKAATKAALSQAAFRLAMEKDGIEAVSPDEIAAAAGVSTRTFHNYFRGKEEALLYDFSEMTRKLLDDLRERSRHQPIWDALRDACISLHLSDAYDVQLLQCREAIVRNSPTLITHQAGQFMELFQDAVGIVAQATGTEPTDLYPRLVLGSALISMKIANEQWIADPDAEPLEAVIAKSFAQFEAGITRPITE